MRYFFIGEVLRMALPSMAKPKGKSEEEFSSEIFKPRTEPFVALKAEWSDRERLLQECERIGRRAPRRNEILLRIATATPEEKNDFGEIPRRLIECDSTILAALRKAGYISIV